MDHHEPSAGAACLFVTPARAGRSTPGCGFAGRAFPPARSVRRRRLHGPAAPLSAPRRGDQRSMACSRCVSTAVQRPSAPCRCPLRAVPTCMSASAQPGSRSAAHHQRLDVPSPAGSPGPAGRQPLHQPGPQSPRDPRPAPRPPRSVPAPGCRRGLPLLRRVHLKFRKEGQRVGHQGTRKMGPTPARRISERNGSLEGPPDGTQQNEIRGSEHPGRVGEIWK